MTAPQVGWAPGRRRWGMVALAVLALAATPARADTMAYALMLMDRPGGWTREEGTGRVCVLTPGHNVEVWLHPIYQALLGNTLRWCGAGEHG